MRIAPTSFARLCALTMIAASVPAAAADLRATGVPEGFGEIAGPRVGLVDLFYGDRKIGETLIEARPGTLRFRSPGEVLAKLTQAVPAPELLSAIAADLPTNTQAVCSLGNALSCGSLEPQVLSIIYNEEKFRVDLFVNPNYLKVVGADRNIYLPQPDAGLSVTSSFGFTASGSLGRASTYNMQNRTIVGFRNARLRANTSVATGLGPLVDDFVAEVDTRTLRFSAGLFWGPGNEFTGQRRIVGAGVGTQFDTFADQDGIHGTPLTLFLAHPARVELLVDGRLVGSRSYEAGNNAIEASGLPNGSYTILFRIHEPNGSVREERRFYVKNGQVPPAGRPILFAYAGMLANTRPHRPVSASDTFYFQTGAAVRLTNILAADVTAFGTQHKAIVQAGGWLIKGPGRLRLAALASSSGDYGALMQGGTAAGGPLSISFDLRRIWSRDGKPLVPLPSYAGSFDTSAPAGLHLAGGAYTQATGSVGLRLGDGFISFVGSYRKDRNLRPDYSIGPSVSWPVVTRNRVQIVLEGSAQRTRTTSAGFAGIRMQLASGPMSMQSRLGGAFQNDGAGRGSRARAVSSFSSQYAHETDGGLTMNFEGGVDRTIDATAARAGGTVASRFGNARADLLRNFGEAGGTQYNVAFQSGIALGSSAAVLGAREMEQSAIVVSVSGDAPDAEFDVLVDEAVRGTIKAGPRLPIFVPAYRSYKVRLVPSASSAINFDASPREVTLYPGNVRSLTWRAEPFVTIFAQAVSPAGTPISNALVEAAKSIAETDGNGYFQIDVRRGESLKLAKGDTICRIDLPDLPVRKDFASIGMTTCK